MPAVVRPVSVRLWFLPIRTRVPLKFGPETLDTVTLARVSMTVRDDHGNEAVGWGETPLSVQWVWPSPLPFQTRQHALMDFTRRLVAAWADWPVMAHPLVSGARFQAEAMLPLQREFNRERPEPEHLPYLAALVCTSPFDLALHDALGNLLHRNSFHCYSRDHVGSDLAAMLEPAADAPGVSFADLAPDHFLNPEPPAELPVWHLVGGLDPLESTDLAGDEPDDGFPVLLEDWIRTDGLTCLKVKLRGTDHDWDLERLRRIAALARPLGVTDLSADFNCTVTDPAYVSSIMDVIERHDPWLWQHLLYIEQPFPYDLESHSIDVHAIARRKPLFLDESAHDWQHVRLGRQLGWNGVALKTCKTLTGALLSLCWARAHGMPLMVQDLTNPMLAIIPHVRLAAHADTIRGVECNAMQFYPQASAPEEAVLPGLYRRRRGRLDLSGLGAHGLGQGPAVTARQLPDPDCRS